MHRSLELVVTMDNIDFLKICSDIISRSLELAYFLAKNKKMVGFGLDIIHKGL